MNSRKRKKARKRAFMRECGLDKKGWRECQRILQRMRGELTQAFLAEPIPSFERMEQAACLVLKKYAEPGVWLERDPHNPRKFNVTIYPSLLEPCMDIPDDTDWAGLMLRYFEPPAINMTHLTIGADNLRPADHPGPTSLEVQERYLQR